jgi:iron-sulfur cluster repair protein YtfE (RIC family)
LNSSLLPGKEDHAAAVGDALAASDPAALLLADHAWLRTVLDELETTAGDGGNPTELRDQMLELAPLIDLHIRREEQALFPALEPIMLRLRRGSTEDMYGEHDAIRIRIDELFAAFHGPIDVAQAFDNLARSLLVHFENEEELIFADVPAELSIEERREVMAKLLALQPDV